MPTRWRRSHRRQARGRDVSPPEVRQSRQGHMFFILGPGGVEGMRGLQRRRLRSHLVILAQKTRLKVQRIISARPISDEKPDGNHHLYPIAAFALQK